MQLLKNEDPRSPLAKATRYQLCQLAKAHGIAEITYGTEEGKPHLGLKEIIEILQNHGIHDIKLPDRHLGDTRPFIVNAEDIEKPAPAPVAIEPVIEKPVSDMNMTEMRKECKRRGIKMVRTDNLSTLRAKLDG